MTIEFPLDGGCKRQGVKLGFELIKLASGHNIYGYGSTRAVINRAVYTLHTCQPSRVSLDCPGFCLFVPVSRFSSDCPGNRALVRDSAH